MPPFRLIAAAGLLWAAPLTATQAAAPVVLTFEGISNLRPVGNFYDGAGGAAQNLGVTFSADGLGLIDQDGPRGPDGRFGSGLFANEPSPSTVLTFLQDGVIVLNYPAGFTDGFATYYVSTDNAFVRAWSGPDGTGTLLAEIHLEDQKLSGAGDPLPINGTVFGVWEPIGASFAGTAHSLTFAGGPNVAAFDNVTLGSSLAGQIQSVMVLVPEPATWILWASGLLGLRLLRARPV